MRSIKRIFNFFFKIGIVLVLFLVLSNVYVVLSTQQLVHESSEDTPATKVALILGTSKRVTNGNPNPYFNYRIDAAYELYASGKVKHFIVSGDNREKYYNEPKDMQQALVKKGVPTEKITLDYAGLRTLDSVIRAKEVFGQDTILVVTQKFHTYRSLFLCKSYGIEAHAYAAKNIPLSLSYKIILREFLARSGAILDVYLLDRQPRHLGESVDIDFN